MLRPLVPYALLAVFALFVFCVIYTPPCGSHENALRFSCQSNLKRIGLAMRQYAQDYDEHLPSQQWVSALTLYLPIFLPGDSLFQCPSTDQNAQTSDYFFNALYFNGRLGTIEDPMRLILLGDGVNDAPLDNSLAQFPSAWHHDENFSVLRHLETANYGFADGHIKALRADRVTNDFQVVTP